VIQLSRSSSKRRREYFAVATEIAPPLLDAIAALAASLALTFVTRRYVPTWSVVLVLAIAVLTILGAGLWSWRARRLLGERQTRLPRTSKNRLAVNSPLWLWASILTALLLTGLSGFVFVRGIKPIPSYASPYDGTDPGTSPCVQSAQPIPDDGRPTLRDQSQQEVGHLELRRSSACATVWAKVYLKKGAAARLKHSMAQITMVRPGDDVKAPFPLPLSGGTEGFGNMLSNAQSCVRAEVVITSPDGKQTGPKSKTECR
jgi:hypothetical protein